MKWPHSARTPHYPNDQIRAAFDSSKAQDDALLLIHSYATPGRHTAGDYVPLSGVLDVVERAAVVCRNTLRDDLRAMRDTYGAVNIIKAYDLSRDFDKAALGTELQDAFVQDCLDRIVQDLDSESAQQARNNQSLFQRVASFGRKLIPIS